MEATILKLLDINKQFVEDSKSPKLSDKIVAHYYNLSEPAKQLHFKDALIQQLYSFSNLNDFTNFSHLLYAALAIKPPNLDGVLYKFLINHKQLNQTFEGHNPNQLCLKILSQIPVNSVYVNNIHQFFKTKVDESIGLHLFHFYAVNKLSNESLSVLSTICDNNLYEENLSVLSFQLFTSLKYVEPEIFEVWLDTKLEEQQIPEYVLEVLRKTFDRAEKTYPENWREYLSRFSGDVQSYKKDEVTIPFAFQKTEIEMKALLLKMNPHFLFNSLNSLKSLIVNNQIEEGVKYLTKFSTLLRSILSNSEKKKIALSHEIEALRFYIELETLRFRSNFNYQIKIDKNIDENFIRVPPLFLQPFVENALQNGLLSKTSGIFKLNINIIRKEDFLFFEIEDNGVGRKKAGTLSKNHFQRPIGIHNTKRIEIIDLADNNNQAHGTKVVIKLYAPE